MSTFWTGLFAVVAVVILAAGASLVWMQWRLNQETITPLTIRNPEGTAGNALLVYQPGLSNFQTRVSEAFAEGLADAGWRIAVTTASREAPADLEAFDLAVLGSPVYGGTPGKALASYIERVGDFSGKPVVILLTGAGDVQPAIEFSEAMVTKAGGRPIHGLGLTAMRPNEQASEFSGSNTDRAIQYARHSALTLQLPDQ